jgi:hypothetical protein
MSGLIPYSLAPCIWIIYPEKKMVRQSVMQCSTFFRIKAISFLGVT